MIDIWILKLLNFWKMETQLRNRWLQLYSVKMKKVPSLQQRLFCRTYKFFSSWLLINNKMFHYRVNDWKELCILRPIAPLHMVVRPVKRENSSFSGSAPSWWRMTSSIQTTRSSFMAFSSWDSCSHAILKWKIAWKRRTLSTCKTTRFPI